MSKFRRSLSLTAFINLALIFFFEGRVWAQAVTKFSNYRVDFSSDQPVTYIEFDSARLTQEPSLIMSAWTADRWSNFEKGSDLYLRSDSVVENDKKYAYSTSNPIALKFKSSLVQKAVIINFYNLQAKGVSALLKSNASLEIRYPMNAKEFYIHGGNHVKLTSMDKITVQTLFCNSIDTLELSSYDAKIDTLVVSYSNLKIESAGPIPKWLQFYKMKQNEVVNLNQFHYQRGQISDIEFYRTDIEKFILNYKYFHLRTFDSAEFLMRDEYEKDLATIKAMQAKYSYSEGYEKADKELKRYRYGRDHSYFLNWIDSYWWDYGYKKSLIIRNSLILMLMFFVINLFFYHRLIHETYVIDEFVSNDKTIDTRFKKSKFKKYAYKGIYCFLYTGFVFWGVKIDLHKIRFHWILPALYIILQYLVGLVCLAYLANYIISK